MTIRGTFSTLALALFLASQMGAGARAERVTIFAAASLTDAMQAAADAYAADAGDTLRFSFAASSTLARQIAAGAPAQIFASASAAWMDHLVDRGSVLAGSRVRPIGNRLVLVAPAADNRARAALTPALDLVEMLEGGRLAVGDPDHVPAGVYARKALESLGLWPPLEARLARADNVRAALALVARGAAPYGIVYATDLRVAPAVAEIATFPADSHPPISYPFAIVAGQDGPAVRRAFAYITGPAGQAVFARFGFTTSSER